jgi:glycosyltransferase involved in cell wall biosynthesis
MELSVIVTTYNSTEWLEKVIWGYQHQNFRNFELLIADDGSTSETADLVLTMRKYVHFYIRHVWQENHGFNKCKILNKAILETSSEYLVFSDGDCIPRSDFLQTHFENSRPNYFLSGGTVRLPLALSQHITREDISDGSAFDKKWLMAHGLKKSLFKNLKLTQNRWVSSALNRLSPTNATWNGGNSSAWKKDILSVNGFNESMRYGAEDREFGERLTNRHIFGIQIRYSAVCIHLDHLRDYINEKDLKRNKEIYQHTRITKSKWTSYGIVKSEDRG